MRIVRLGKTQQLEALAAKAGFDAVAANYRQTVLKGLLEVADVLSALYNNARTLSALTAGAGAAQGQLAIIFMPWAMRDFSPYIEEHPYITWN